MMVHNLVIKPTDTRVVGDVAYDVGTYSQSLMPMKGSGKTIDDKGKYVVLLKKDASGGWAIAYAIYNSDMPLPPPPPPAK
jgi:ketosteroid isomerase-like protein